MYQLFSEARQLNTSYIQAIKLDFISDLCYIHNAVHIENNVVQGVYDNGDILENQRKSIFISIPKKSDGNECKLGAKINLMINILCLEYWWTEDVTELNRKQQ